MKKAITIGVSKPCGESWSAFTKTKNGGFCQSCQKEVIDFTKMSDAELITYLRSTKSGTCGKFNPAQLKTYHSHPQSAKGYNWVAGAIGLSLMLGVPQILPAQSIPTPAKITQTPPEFTTEETVNSVGDKIKGRVVDDSNDPLPGVTVYVKGTTVGTVTDIDGNFEIKEDLQEGSVLVFSFIGMVSKEVTVDKLLRQPIEVPMIAMVCDVMGKVAIDGFYEEPGILERVWLKLKSWVGA